jgi:hypothetical protein
MVAERNTSDPFALLLSHTFYIPEQPYEQHFLQTLSAFYTAHNRELLRVMATDLQSIIICAVTIAIL